MVPFSLFLVVVAKFNTRSERSSSSGVSALRRHSRRAAMSNRDGTDELDDDLSSSQRNKKSTDNGTQEENDVDIDGDLDMDEETKRVRKEDEVFRKDTLVEVLPKGFIEFQEE